MGFWEITFLIWVAGAVGITFFAIVDDKDATLQGFMLSALLLWPLTLTAILADRVRWLLWRR